MTDLFWDAVSASLRNKRSLFKKNYQKKKNEKRNRYVTRTFTELKMLSVAAQFWKLSLKNNFFCSEILYGEQIGYVICFK